MTRLQIHIFKRIAKVTRQNLGSSYHSGPHLGAKFARGICTTATSKLEDAKNDKPMHVPYYADGRKIRIALRSIKGTYDLEKAWRCYEEFKALNPPMSTLTSNLASNAFHRLVLILSKERPRTRHNLIRLLGVFDSLHQGTGKIFDWEWNVLMHYSGNCYRKGTEEDYQAAVGIYNDMVNYQKARQQKLERTQNDVDGGNANLNADETSGDITTFTTLLSVALHSGSGRALQHASRLLNESQLPPTATTELAILKHFARTGETAAACAVIEHVHTLGHEIGIAGLNHLFWVHASNGSFQLPLGIYRAMRDRFIATPAEYLARFRCVNNIGSYNVPDDLQPDRTTFTLLIQCLAYHGHFGAAMELFSDLLVFRQQERDKSLHNTSEEYFLPVYRALFLGFYKHGSVIEPGQASAGKGATQESWSLKHLEIIFRMFLRVPDSVQPSDRMLYWIIMAFKRTSSDASKVADVWSLLDSRFKKDRQWIGRMEKLSNNLLSQVKKL